MIQLFITTWLRLILFSLSIVFNQVGGKPYGTQRFNISNDQFSYLICIDIILSKHD